MTFSCDIYRADCLTVLPTIPDASVDCIFIDPPYGTGNNKDKSVKYDRNVDFARKNWVNFHADWDSFDNYPQWCYQWLEQSKRILTDTGTIFICGSFHNIPDVALALRALDMYTIQWIQWCIPNSFPQLSMTKMINANQTIIWARKGKRHYYDKEAAKRYNDGKNLRDYWIINQDTRGTWKHPSKKPFYLVYRALDIALPKDRPAKIVDFFAGSGSTGEAAAHICANYQTPVSCGLVEQSSEYIDTIKARVNHGCQNSKIVDTRIQTIVYAPTG